MKLNLLKFISFDTGTMEQKNIIDPILKFGLYVLVPSLLFCLYLNITWAIIIMFIFFTIFFCFFICIYCYALKNFPERLQTEKFRLESKKLEIEEQSKKDNLIANNIITDGNNNIRDNYLINKMEVEVEDDKI